MCLSQLDSDQPMSILSKRFETFEDIRVKRASVMQIFSNAGQDEPERVRRDASIYIPENEIPRMIFHSLIVKRYFYRKLTSQ
jgi:hypothetical protein